MRKFSINDVLQSIKVAKPNQLLQFLIDSEVRKSRNDIKTLLVSNRIVVNNKTITQYNHPLVAGDMVEVMRHDQSKKEKKLLGLRIVYEDDVILVINKDAGFLSVATHKEKAKTAYNVLTDYVKKKRKMAQIYVLHRMDREMSGLMVFAKDEDIQAKLQKNWDLLVLEHLHMGVIDGKPLSNKGVIRSWLTENKNYKVFSSGFDNGGIEAVTEYRTLQTNDRYSLVEFKQITRGKNQIRAQMEQLECPIVGDKKYGAKDNPIKRIALHVSCIKLRHPISGEILVLESPVTKAMLKLVN